MVVALVSTQFARGGPWSAKTNSLALIFGQKNNALGFRHRAPTAALPQNCRTYGKDSASFLEKSKYNGSNGAVIEKWLLR